jgi:hypothetical protein
MEEADIVPNMAFIVRKQFIQETPSKKVSPQTNNSSATIPRKVLQLQG